ncbi:alpha/beta hydrolase [Pontibacter silvestris]|uniref:Alpha/beta hydrolase n=1 Tax=Pontibacter silvestris TaxID=2305183 RepID=A0ABW4WUC4_9BACT|nr:alpha/beta hydrolase-fold protein [Pontibacter silvestris]MCC9138413.1 hypothetical protein [Pontibacter silvestris]
MKMKCLIKFKVSYPVYVSTFMLLFQTFTASSQNSNSAETHQLYSNYLHEQRTFWVSLPAGYDATKKYPVMYVLDAESRFDVARVVAHDRARYKKAVPYIIVGVPNMGTPDKRSNDLTFSTSLYDYHGKPLDVLRFDSTNTGGGMDFSHFINEELVPHINSLYPTSNQNVLVGHSFSGYFASYILPLQQTFTTYLLIDPSIWYNRGEALEHLKSNAEALRKSAGINVYVSYQSRPAYNVGKVKELVAYLSKQDHVTIAYKQYLDETHGSIFLQSFVDGMNFISSLEENKISNKL